ncbi:cornifelin homolog [Hippocampus comes]|uniref:Cornifelin n=1 Tax=Hippocampus comes TaxID=109280 RepID=A0A3Q2XXS3_HIPCM|nr:PREDICTED: cornifelin [Hippocampus comes]
MSFQPSVISSQPQVSVHQYAMSDWSSNTLDCCDNCGICLCGTFLPCILECKVAQDHGESCCLAFLPSSSVALRTSIRHKYRIEGSVCKDWLVMACLPLCGLCQMAREQKMRG